MSELAVSKEIDPSPRESSTKVIAGKATARASAQTAAS